VGKGSEHFIPRSKSLIPTDPGMPKPGSTKVTITELKSILGLDDTEGARRRCNELRAAARTIFDKSGLIRKNMCTRTGAWRFDRASERGVVVSVQSDVCLMQLFP